MSNTVWLGEISDRVWLLLNKAFVTNNQAVLSGIVQFSNDVFQIIYRLVLYTCMSVINQKISSVSAHAAQLSFS